MENLSKENFWDQLQEKNPRAMDLFNKWIDKYKEEVGWVSLFGPDLKFHDMPFEFQNGVIARFDIECHAGIFSGKGQTQYKNNRGKYVQEFINLFSEIEFLLKNSKDNEQARSN